MAKISSRVAGVMLTAVATLNVHAEDALPRETLTFTLPPAGPELVGQEHIIHTRVEDTFADIGAQYAVGYRELKIANPRVDPWLPGDGTSVIIPQRFVLPDAKRQGIVLNTAEMRLYYYPTSNPNEVLTFPISVGRGAWQTPTGTTKVIAKVPNPVWYPPKSVLTEYKKEGRTLDTKVPPGPDNPLGQYALDLGFHGYLIHGTNHPYAIGMQVTHGCIRLHPHDIALLFSKVARFTTVTIVNQPFKAGWQDNVLYLEAHPPLDVSATDSPDLSAMVNAVVRATGNVSDFWVNWDYARTIALKADGLPHAIGKRVPATNQVTQR